MFDLNGKEWARVAEVKVGSHVIPDSDFAGSLANSAAQIVQEDEHGLFIEGVAGPHYLSGQIDYEAGTHYIGLWLKSLD